MLQWNKKRLVLILVAVVSGTALSLLTVGRYRGQFYDRYAYLCAMRMVGSASIEYLARRGAPPRDVQDLFDADLVRLDPSGELAVCGYSSQVSGPARAQAVLSMKLSFPETTVGCKLLDDRIVESATGEEITVISGDLVWITEQQRVNRYFARKWLRVARGLEEGAVQN